TPRPRQVLRTGDQQGLAGADGRVRPGGFGPLRHVQSMLDVLTRCERVAIGDGFGSRGVIPCTQARLLAVGIVQRPTDLEWDGGNLRLLPGVSYSPNPGLIMRQRPIGLRLITEGHAWVKMSDFRVPVLRPLRLLADSVSMLKRV